MFELSIETLLLITAFATTAIAGASIGIYWTLRRLDDGTRDWEAFTETSAIRDSADSIPRLPEKASVIETLRFIACAQRSLLALNLPQDSDYQPMAEDRMSREDPTNP